MVPPPLDPGSAYNGPAAVLLQGSLNVAALEQHQRNCAATRSFADVLSGCGGATSAEDCFGSECPCR